ncbi:MAG TPA: sigma-70 family RNA polymerase sigma factor [Actinomycetota bacterium]|nr:sigma-70 family RNA polymerase sigma factor [Actinomycetota bacterium]
MGDPGSDDDLVRRYLAGDANAFATLMRRHETRIYTLCLRTLGNADDAADAAQDAFLTALRKLEGFRGEAAFGTWLHRVAVNACYDLLRKRRRQPMLRLAEDEEHPRAELEPAEPDIAEEVVGTQDAAAALRLIPEEFRIALILADVQDLAYDQIARILEVPVGTVKSRVHRGRVALARILDPSDGEPDPVSRTSQEEA